jgi:hypothetical protein
MRSSTASVRNSLLNDVVANFPGTLSEREFFEAFAAILRANRFFDVHLLHGITEFGKDFIAKRIESDGSTIQYAIQTKVGDIKGAEWHEVRNQIETIRVSTLSHPSDDLNLSRRAILALTGRLAGLAPTETQNYKQRFDTDDFKFEVWQLDNLLSMMTDAPEAGLAGEPDAPLLGAVAAIYEETFTESHLELISRGWANPVGDVAGLWRSALAGFVLAHRLSVHGRRDLAALVGLHLIRAAWARCDNREPIPEDVIAVADAGKGLLISYVLELFELVNDLPGDPREFVAATSSFGDFVAYPVRCLRLLELFGLLGLATEDNDLRDQIKAFCVELIRRHPGSSHPISDHWAVSIPPIALLLHAEHPDLVGRWLEEICVWLADAHESGRAGFAAPWTEADEEVQQWLIGGLQLANLDKRSDSFLASVLLDLASSLEMPDVYDGLINEIMAVGIYPNVVEANGSTGFYQDNLGDVFVEPWVQYDGRYSEYEGWESSEPHRNLTPTFLERAGRPWDLIALSSVLRDRWFPLAWRILGKVEA